MIHRRLFLASALAVLPADSFARASRMEIKGTFEQGSLAIGTVAPRTRVSVGGKPVDVSPDGIFAFGFDYDQTKPSTVVARFADGGHETRVFTPTIRHYEIQRVNGLPQATVTPPPDVLARIKREAANIYVARQRNTPHTWFADGFDWPAPGIESGVFGSQRIDNGTPMAPHFGVDMAAPTGTPIHAPATGIVTVAGDYYLDGGFTLIDHGQGVSTCYLHQSKLLVKVGQKVTPGEKIGLIGQTGRATGPHLHWAMNWFEVKLDPSRSTRKPKPDPL